MNFTVLNVRFFLCRDHSDNVKLIELKNSTKCDAKYLFDLDTENDLLELTKNHGVIPPRSKINLKIIFKPTEHGIYYKQIYGLIQYHVNMIKY